MDLFDLNNNAYEAKPLADKMRPSNLDEFVGQTHIVGEGSLLRRAIRSNRLGSCIFWGPPGVGKTTLAHIIASTANGNFVRLNAVQSGVSDIKKAAEEAKNALKMYGKRTFLLLDECHRFNKAQSDSLLPLLEDGTLVLIGSTTENPYASMTPAIVSRCRVFAFRRLTSEEILGALKKALVSRKGLKEYRAACDEEALLHIARFAGGDLRAAYNALELAVLTTPPAADGSIHMTLADAEQSIQQKSLAYNEDAYYDILSAFCKSLRGSDADAALYYAFRLIEGGCDPMAVCRRLVVHASEDVGMADPNALTEAVAAMQAYEKLGSPEGLIPLSQAIVYVAEAEKSNSVILAMQRAQNAAKNVRDDEIPPYLRDTSYGDANAKAQGKSYKYPHDYGGWVEQQYLPDSLRGEVFYQPKENGYEKTVRQVRLRKGKKS